MGGNDEFFENFERNKYLKKLPSMQRVKCYPPESLVKISSNLQYFLSSYCNFIRLILSLILIFDFFVNAGPGDLILATLCRLAVILKDY